MKLFLQIIVNLCVATYDFIKKIGSSIFNFCKRVLKSTKMMSLFEKRLAITFFVIALILTGVKVKHEYSLMTKIVPGEGGVYREAVVGEYKYFNPILASSDVEKSTSKLIFSGLVKFDKDNNTLPDLAEKWDVSADGLKYNFYLKNNIYFHDGEKLSAEDIVFTINKIKDPVLKSPLYNAWADVEVSSASTDVVTFDLPKAYGPFIYNCDFGILPAHISDDQFSKKIIGEGPYKFVKSKTKDSKITKIYLAKNDKYFGGEPHISKIELDLYKSDEEAKKDFTDNANITALAGGPVSLAGSKSWDFETTKRLGLVFNLRKDNLKDKAFRQKILSGEKGIDKITLTLSTLDNDGRRQKAEELKKQFSDRNIDLDIKYYSSTEMQDVLSKKDYELLLYGFDFGHDRDPYPFWHSTELDKLNLAGYSDKSSDILVEDARMITDPVQRNAKYDQFYDIVKSESLAVFYDPILYQYNFRTDLRGVSLNCNDVEYRYNGIENWYFKEKRVRK